MGATLSVGSSSIARRVVAACLASALLLMALGRTFSEPLASAVERVLRGGQRDFSGIAVRAQWTDRQATLIVRATPTPELVARHPALIPGVEWQATTQQAFAATHVVWLTTLLHAWPAGTGRERRWRWLLAPLALLLLLTADLPPALHGLLLSGVLQHGGLERGWDEPQVLYADFLQAGGRALLDVLAASAVIVAARRLSGYARSRSVAATW